MNREGLLQQSRKETMVSCFTEIIANKDGKVRVF